MQRFFRIFRRTPCSNGSQLYESSSQFDNTAAISLQHLNQRAVPVGHNSNPKSSTHFYQRSSAWITLLTLLGVINALIFFLLQWIYQDWTARKDFLEYCQSLEAANITLSTFCDRALTTPLPPPPFSHGYSIRRSIVQKTPLLILIFYGETSVLKRILVTTLYLCLLFVVTALTVIFSPKLYRVLVKPRPSSYRTEDLDEATLSRHSQVQSAAFYSTATDAPESYGLRLRNQNSSRADDPSGNSSQTRIIRKRIESKKSDEKLNTVGQNFSTEDFEDKLDMTKSQPPLIISEDGEGDSDVNDSMSRINTPTSSLDLEVASHDDDENSDHVRCPPRSGVVDFPISENTPLSGIWNHEPNEKGPIIAATQGALDISRGPVMEYNQWTKLSIQHQLEAKGGTIITFKVQYDFIRGTPEVKFKIPANLGLRYDGKALNYCWWDEEIQWFHNVGCSTVEISGSSPTTVMLIICPLAIQIFEDGNRLGVWETEVATPFYPLFNWQILAKGATLHTTLSDITFIEPIFNPGQNTPWDYAFSAPSDADPDMHTSTSAPARDSWTITHRPSNVMAVTYSPEGYMRISTPSLTVGNAWAFTSAPTPQQTSPAHGILQYRFRVNASGGAETKVTLSGGLILRVTAGGRHAEWDLYVDDWFVKQGDTAIVVGSGLWTVVMVVYSPTQIALFEDGEMRFAIARPELLAKEPLWKEKEVLFYVQHLDVGTDVSVDLSHVRCVPGIKSEGALVEELRKDMLLSYRLEGGGNLDEALSRGCDPSLDLIPTDGVMLPDWIQEGWPTAVDFAPNADVGRALCLPMYPCGRTFEAYTLGLVVKIEAVPTGQIGDERAGILGPLSLRPDGRLEVAFQCFSDARLRQAQTNTFVSRAIIPLRQWIYVTITYCHDMARWTLYIDGKLDTVVYTNPADESSHYAITPMVGYIGATNSASEGNLVVLQGQVCDVKFWKQAANDSVTLIIANRSLADRAF